MSARGQAEECCAFPLDKHAASAQATSVWAALLLFQGGTEEAIRRILIKSAKPSDRAKLGYAYARSGRRDEAEKLAMDLPTPLQQALVFAGLGDKDRTLELLDRMAVLGPVRVGWLLSNPELALLRGDPR